MEFSCIIEQWALPYNKACDVLAYKIRTNKFLINRNVTKSHSLLYTTAVWNISLDSTYMMIILVKFWLKWKNKNRLGTKNWWFNGYRIILISKYKMAELHTLNVSSGPTSKHGGSVEKIEPNDLTFPQLQAAKDKLESEIQALGRLLQSVCLYSHPA